MKKTSLIILLSLSFSGALAEPAVVTYSDLLENLVDLETTYLPPLGAAGEWSSHDRRGGNRDGEGYIRKEGGMYVLAEMDGPGAVTRIWSDDPQGKIEIYVDDGGSPLVSMDFNDLFSGAIKPFAPPLIQKSSAQSGGFSYIPIPYAKSCRIVSDTPGYYQIDYLTFPLSTEVETLELPLSAANTKKTQEIIARLKPSARNRLPFASADVQKKTFALTVPAGETITPMTLEGPAVLRGLELKWNNENLNDGRDLVLSLYWDGGKNPCVYSPVHDFFGGLGETLAVGRNKTQGYCFFPMPFLEKAVLTLENGNLKKPLEVELTYYIEPVKELPQPLRKFHAMWRRDNGTPVTAAPFDSAGLDPLCNAEQNYMALDITAKGHLAGLSLHRTEDAEGDSMIFTGNERKAAALLGTGRNGFFNGKEGVKTFSHPFCAFVEDVKGLENPTRIFLAEKTGIDKRMVVSFEHGLSNTRQMDFSSVVYWYQEEPHKPYDWMQPLKGRHFRETEVAQQVFSLRGSLVEPDEVTEGEYLESSVVGGFFEPQDMTPHGPDWSRHQQLRFEGYGEGSYISLKFPRNEYSGWFHLEGGITRSPDGGIVEIKVMDVVIEPGLDLYAPTYERLRITSKKPFFIHAGEQVDVRFIVTGRNEDSVGLAAGVDNLNLAPSVMQPETLSVNSPLYITPGESERNLLQTQSSFGTNLILGYIDPQRSEQKAENQASERDGSFIISPPPQNENKPFLAFIRWDLTADRAGIYEFEVESSAGEPMLTNLASDRIESQPGRILVNGIPLQGDATRRWDASVNRWLPMKFSLPLQKGQNQICWLLTCTEKTSFRPKLYGAKAENN